MFLLSLLHLRVPPGIVVRMPRAARVTTETVVATARRSGRPRTVANYASQMAVEGHEGVMGSVSESPLADLESEGAAEPPPKRKRRRRVKVAEPVVYDIPPVETKTSTFKGKSGVQIHVRSRVYEYLTPRPIGIRAFHVVDMTYVAN